MSVDELVGVVRVYFDDVEVGVGDFGEVFVEL